MNELGHGSRPIQIGKENGQFFGKYRGIVTKVNDPTMRGRIRARVPYPLGDVETDWADACFSPGFFNPPHVGDGVWVEFENGDLSQPLWSGQWYRQGESPFQAVTTDTQQDDPEIGTTALEDAQHKPFHNHQAGERYNPHVRAWRLPSGHYLLFDDWRDSGDKKKARIVLADRDGRSLVISEEGIIDLFAGKDVWIRIDSRDDEERVTLRAKRVVLGDEDAQLGFIDLSDPDGKIIIHANEVYAGSVAGSKKLMTEDDAADIKASITALQSHTHAGVSPGASSTAPPAGIPAYNETLTEKTKAS